MNWAGRVCDPYGLGRGHPGDTSLWLIDRWKMSFFFFPVEISVNITYHFQAGAETLLPALGTSEGLPPSPGNSQSNY